MVPKTCKSWLCRSCSTWLRTGARAYVAAGLERGADEGHGLAMFVFGDDGHGLLELRDVAGATKSAVRQLRRRGLLLDYLAAVEFRPGNGTLHAHVLAHVPRDRWGELPSTEEAEAKRRSRAAWALHFGELVPLAERAGWGPWVGATRIEDIGSTSRYAVKQLAGYATKEAATKFRQHGAHRVRPLRASSGWTPGRTLRDFQQSQGRPLDPGPWVDVTSVCG